MTVKDGCHHVILWTQPCEENGRQSGPRAVRPPVRPLSPSPLLTVHQPHFPSRLNSSNSLPPQSLCLEHHLPARCKAGSSTSCGLSSNGTNLREGVTRTPVTHRPISSQNLPLPEMFLFVCLLPAPPTKRQLFEDRDLALSRSQNGTREDWTP